MAKTKAGKKIVPVKSHSRGAGSSKVTVSGHRRSTPHTSTGAAK